MSKKKKTKTAKTPDTKTKTDTKKATEASTIRTGSAGERKPSVVISYGSHRVDQYMTDYGGIPTGCYIVISSRDEGVFKTTTGNHMLRQIQQQGYPVGVVDTENKWSFKRARDIGLDPDGKHFYYDDPVSGEAALASLEHMMLEKRCKAIMLDSVDGAQPEIEMTHEYGDSHIGTHARLFNRAARRLSKLAKHNDCLLIFINQQRGNMVDMRGAPKMMGYKDSGGRGLPFYSLCNFVMLREEAQSSMLDKDLLRVKVAIRRNSMGPSWKEISVPCLQDYGIDPYSEMVEIGLERGIIYSKGAWYYLGEQTIGQGFEAARDHLQLHNYTIAKEDDKLTITNRKNP